MVSDLTEVDVVDEALLGCSLPRDITAAAITNPAATLLKFASIFFMFFNKNLRKYNLSNEVSQPFNLLASLCVKMRP